MTASRITNQQILDESKRNIIEQFPEFVPQLFDFLERDQSTICYARSWRRGLAALRVAPSRAVSQQFGISLEIPVLIATFGRNRLEPRVLRDLDTLRASSSADKDIAILVASDERANDFVKDRKRFAFPILVLNTDKLREDGYAGTNLRTELARLLRSVNHFDYSNEIRSAADFFGRLDEIDALTALAAAGQSVGLFGLRRAGKTSLLYRVREALDSREIASIYLQLNALVDEQGFRDGILRDLARLAADRGRPTKPRAISTPITPREWVYGMDALLDEIDCQVVVIIDEIDLANEDAAEYDNSEIEQRRRLNRVLQQLRGIIQIRNDRGQHPLSFLAAGVAASVFTQAIRFGRDNQLFGFASARPLKPMSRDEMRDMVRSLGKRSGLKFNDYRLFNMLFSEYGGHPHLTRQACSVVAERRQDAELGNVPYVVSTSDLEAAVASTGEGSPASAAWQTLRSFERWYPDEAEFVHEVAATRRPCSDASRISHAIDFGLCNEDGTLRMGALVRTAQR